MSKEYKSPQDITFNLKGLTAKRYKKILKKDKTGRMKVVFQKYFQYHKERVAGEYYTEEDGMKYIKKFIYLVSLMESTDKIKDKAVSFIFNYVGNLVMKMRPDDLATFIEKGDDRFLVKSIVEALQNEWDEERFGDTLGFWFNTLLPMIAGYITVPYITFSMWLFRPDLYKIAEIDVVRFTEVLNRAVYTVYQEVGINPEWVIIPRDFFEPQKIRNSSGLGALG